MATANDTASMALFCDFENIALGVRDAQYEKFDIRPVLERLLAKGSIVVKKAYCDWDRYKAFKAAMHEANFELIEIPHVRQSGKNSADIRMVVDALDLCYTKAHVDTFVIISGDSDFSPLVSKLRENAKKVIGVGVKQSCSDLLVTNCDEFIYYDDLVRDRDGQRPAERRERDKRTPEEEARRREKQEERKVKAIDIVASTFVDLIADRGDSERIWASVLKEVVKRRNPGFNESYYGFRTFGNLLEEAAAQGRLGFGRDDKGAFVFRAAARTASIEGDSDGTVDGVVIAPADEETKPTNPASEAIDPVAGGRRRNGRRGRGSKDRPAIEDSPTPGVADDVALPETAVPADPVEPVAGSESEIAHGEVETKPVKARRGRKEPSATTADVADKRIASGMTHEGNVESAASAEPPVEEAGQAENGKKGGKTEKASRTPRAPRKPKVAVTT